MNNDVAKVISAEWLKLKRRRTTIVVPVLVGLFAVVTFFGLDFAVRRQVIGLPNGFNVAAATISLLINVVVLVAVVATCFHISREFALGTIKSAWVRPITRNAWYSGKILSACGAIALLFLFTVGIVVVLAAFRFGFSDLMEKDYLVHPAGSLGWRMVLTVGLTLWSLWALIAVVAMLAGLINHPGGAIAAALGLGLLLTVLAIFPALRPYLLSTYLSLPIDQMSAMSKGLPLPLSWSQVIRHTLIGAGVWIIVTFIVGQQIIKRKQITF